MNSPLPPEESTIRIAAVQLEPLIGSFICRDEDGQNRNAWLLIAPDGRILGRHDKDVPRMWENCYQNAHGDGRWICLTPWSRAADRPGQPRRRIGGRSARPGSS